MKGFGLYLLILLVLLAAATAALSQDTKSTQLAYSDVVDYFENGEITQFSVDDNVLHARLKDGTQVGQPGAVPDYHCPDGPVLVFHDE